MSRPTPLPIAAGLCLLLLGACQSQKARAREAEELAQDQLARWFPEAARPVDRASLLAALVPATPVESPAPSPDEEQVRVKAQAALAQADFEGARDALVELLGPRDLDQAERVLEAGDPARALALLDRCARTAPESPRLYSLRARARYLVGVQQGADGRELVLAALDDGLRSARTRGGPREWAQASEAAFWLGEVGAAREYSEQACERSAGLADGAAERARAQASVAELQALEQGALKPDELAEPVARTRRALEEFLGFAPADLWAWQQLTELLEQHELPGRAMAATARALEFAPADAVLQQRFARLALALGGRERLLAEYAQFQKRHSGVALADWYPAVQHYLAGVELVVAERDAREPFRAAEAGFARARELDPQLTDESRAYEAACRVGRGWSQLFAGELEAAEGSLRSAEELVPGTLLRALPAELPSGLAALDRLARAWTKSSLEHAGLVFEELHRLAPSSPNWANEAGLALRDAADALEKQGRAACTRGARAEAETLFVRAREMMERSYRAYSEGVALAPQDVQLVNDCALILVYHLQRDADEAERMLRRALQLGAEQLPALERAASQDGLDAEQKSARKLEQQRLISSMGDAWQNLGVLYLTLRGDARQAQECLEKSRGMGPDPRPEVFGPGGYLEQARAALGGTLDPRVRDATRWAAPCKDA